MTGEVPPPPKHALVTVVAPIPFAQVIPLTQRLASLGNPASPAIAQALDRLDGDHGTHFVSLHAIASGDGRRGHLILELSGDGDDEAALTRVASALHDTLSPLFAAATDRRAGGSADDRSLVAYLMSHRIRPGHGWFSHPGLAFAGTPGLTVGRIRQEALLAARAADLLAQQPGDRRALDRLTAVRTALGADEKFAPLLAEAPPLVPPRTPPSKPMLIGAIAWDFSRTYLWPILIVAAVAMLIAGVRSHSVGDAFHAGLTALWVGLLAFVGLMILLYALLRRAERRDVPSEREPDAELLRSMVHNENRGAQNHMLSVTRRKSGLVRWVAIRFVMWLIAALSARKYQPGHLGEIGTIHFARWVTVPGTRDYLFFSNYGGSWESYLEDFITRAHAGLTGAWSSSEGFPRSANLVQGGATDGERFKRYARQSMQPTPFWYSAYPALTTANIRTNAAIRHGLATAHSADQAARWLALFGSAERPPGKIESSDVQSLVFGGLGFMPHGCCLSLSLPPTTDQARLLLGRLRPHIAFNDGRLLRRRAVLTVALAHDAFARLGLPEACIDSFPPSFRDGMASPDRSRMLGDIGENASDRWWWRGDGAPQVTLLVYGVDAAAVERLEGVVRRLAADHGGSIAHRVALRPIGPDKREPFGFVDGVSQPVIRGTYKGLKSADPIHLVEPDEFLLGYPDNRGNRPPGPRLAAAADPGNRLPVDETGAGETVDPTTLPREIARNCSYLVIRQLEQDVAAFDTFCAEEAGRLADRLGPPYRIDKEFVAAKLVGRWQDGSSLVRHAYQPLGEERQARATARPQAAPPPDVPAVPAAPKPTFERDNDFLFGAEDPEALRCPFGAHIRRANPRDSLAPGSSDQIDISNRHRILRVGRLYAPEPGQKPGLMFMCLNGDIERQFEFVQQTWLDSPAFHGLAGERDPLLGAGSDSGFVIPTRDGPVRLRPPSRFVTVRGGGYFLLPSRRLIDFLALDQPMEHAA